jgi:hypothetical protein
MINQYKGTCRKCGKEVAAGAGTCEKVNGKWIVEHTTCPQAETITLPDDWDAVQAAGSKNIVNRACCKCGREVGIGEGLCARSADGTWYTWHTDCSTIKPTATTQARPRTSRYSTSPRSTAVYDLCECDPTAERIA